MFARVLEMVRRPAPQECAPSVEFTYKVGGEIQEIKNLNAALKITSSDAGLCLNILTHVFRVWVRGSEAYLLGSMTNVCPPAQVIFGKCFEEHGLKRLMYTLTVDGCELRVWHGPYSGRVSEMHVDSYGSGNLLLDIHGKRAEVAKYLAMFQEILPLKRREEIKNTESYT